MSQINSKLITFVFCMLLTTIASHVFAQDAEQYRAKLRQMAETPFSGDVTEYKAFSQNLGDLLVAAADEMSALPDLSPDDIRFAILMKYWGLVRKFGFDRNEFDQHLEKFAKSIEDIAEVNDLFKTIMLSLYRASHDSLFDIDDPKEKAEAFIRHRDRFIPYMTQYCAEEDDRQLTIYMGQIMLSCDIDGSFGLVESTVEKLMPLLTKQEQSPSPDSKSTSKMVQGMGHRVQLTGKEIKYEGVSTSGELIDVKDFRGKIVFLNFDYLRGNAVETHKKLYDALHNSGLIVITHDPMDSREVARKKAEDAGIPWIITCRSARYEKNLEDYYQNWGLTRALFLIDRDGIVIRSWSHGFCPAACEELKKLFPDKADVLSGIAAELVQQERELKNEMAKWREKSPNPQANELNEMRSAMMSATGDSLFSDVLTPQIYAHTLLELANALLSTPQTTQEQWGGGARSKLEALESLARQQLVDHSDMDPVEAFKEHEQVVDELQQSPNAEYMSNVLFHAKISILFEMRNYLNRMTDSKADYAGEILKRWVDLLNNEIDFQKSRPKDKQNTFLLVHYNDMMTRMLIDAMEEIDEDGSQGLVASLCDELATLLEASGFYELQENAERLRSIERRVSSVGKEFEFECVLMNGKTINVKDLRGKIVLVNFWATWCGPCLGEFPNMKTQYEKYKSQGYEMIALSTDAEVEKIAEFQEKNDYPWLVGSLVKSRDAGLVDYHAYYGIQGIPTSFLLDRNGTVLFRMVGSDDEQLNRELEKAFGK